MVDLGVYLWYYIVVTRYSKNLESGGKKNERKLSNFCDTTVRSSLINYRYGELIGIIDTMCESDMISKEDYVALIRLIDFIYDVQIKEKKEKNMWKVGEQNAIV